MILQNLLTIGNFMNAGNKLKGQADGFEINTLSQQAFSIKDNNKKSLIVTVIHQIMKEDDKFVFFKQNFNINFTDLLRCPVAYLGQ